MWRRVALILGMVSAGCSTDAACKPLEEVHPTLEARFRLPEEEGQGGELAGLGRALTPELATRLLRESELLRGQLPRSAKDADLQVLVEKLARKHDAFDQALRDFLALDPARLQGGLDSPTTMPARRSIVMSRNGLIQLVEKAHLVCQSHK